MQSSESWRFPAALREDRLHSLIVVVALRIDSSQSHTSQALSGYKKWLTACAYHGESTDNPKHFLVNCGSSAFMLASVHSHLVN